MKKILMIFMLACMSILPTIAETQWYRTTAFAQASIYGGSYHWGDWESSNMNISINLSTDVITIYSPSKQVYYVYGSYNNGNMYTDNNGGRNIKFYVIDQDNDKGEIRLRIESNGNSQIYVDFKNIAWVYNVVRTQ